MLAEPQFLDFVHIGGPRAGSAWLSAVLRGHPDVFVPPAKDRGFFGDRYPARPGFARIGSLEDYRRRFEGAPSNAILGDVSPFHMADPNCAARLGRHFPDLKVVAILRQPLDMLVSLYRHLRRRERRAATFEAEIEARPHLLDLAYYHRLLTPWFDCFPRERIFVGIYEDFFADERRSLPDLLRFLAVNDRFRSPLIGRKVGLSTGAPPSRIGRLRGDVLRLAQSPVMRPVRGALETLCAEPAPLRGVRRRFATDHLAETIDPALRRDLMTRLTPDIRRLEGLLGRDLARWREPAPALAHDNVVWLDLRPRRLPAPTSSLQGTDA